MSIDTTKGIWEHRYMVKLPTIAATSKAFLQNHGTYITGDSTIDRSINKDTIVTYLNIDSMLEYWREGVHLILMNPSDAKKIYEDIENHLLAWIEHLQYGLNTANAPIQDLIDLDNFASVVYPHAKKHISKELLDDTFGRRMHDKFGFTPNTFFVKKKTEEENLPDRTPFSSYLKSKLPYRG